MTSYDDSEANPSSPLALWQPDGSDTQQLIALLNGYFLENSVSKEVDSTEEVQDANKGSSAPFSSSDTCSDACETGPPVCTKLPELNLIGDEGSSSGLESLFAIAVSRIEAEGKATYLQQQQLLQLTELSTKPSKPKTHLCLECNKSFDDIQQLKEHVSCHSDPHLCSSCGKTFKLMSHLSRHNAQVHPIQKDHVCPDCGKGFAKLSSLQNHVAVKHKGERHCCDMCDRTFSDKCTLTRHRKSHISMENVVILSENDFVLEQSDDDSNKKESNSEPEQLSSIQLYDSKISFAFDNHCTTTPRSSQVIPLTPSTINSVVLQLEALDEALLQKFEKVDTPASPKRSQFPYTCQYCDKGFNKHCNLRTHVASVHLKERKHACKECGRKFFEHRKMRYHMETVHNTARPYACDVCKKRFSERSRLNSHIESLHNPKHIMRAVSKPLNSSTVFRDNSGQYTCPTCSKGFSRRTHLQNHVARIHLGEKNHTCDLCGKKFFEFSKLQSHISTVHKKERKYKCIFCDKDYSCKTGLQKHEVNIHRVQTNSGKFECDVCKKLFHHQVNLTLHLERIHSRVS